MLNEVDAAELRNRAADTAMAPTLLTMALKMLSWRLSHADRTLTGYRATPQGLQERR
jgi:hypothetical protein